MIHPRLHGILAVLLVATSTAHGQWASGSVGPPGVDPMAGVYAPGYGGTGPMSGGRGMPAPGGYYPASMLQPMAQDGMGGGLGQPVPMGGGMGEDPSAYIAPPDGFIASRSGLFYFQLDALWLQRSAPGNQQFPLYNTAALAPGQRPILELPTATLGLPMTLAPRLTAGFQTANGSEFEASYYGTYYAHGQEEMTAPTLPAIGANAAYTGFLTSLIGTTPRGLLLDGSSKLISTEFNYYQSVSWFSLMAGFRWIQFQDYFSVLSLQNIITSANNIYDIQANNTLLGGQIGARAKGQFGLVGLSGTMKLGVYQDQVAVSQNAVTTGYVVFRNTMAENSRGVLGSEANVTASVLLNSNASMRVGMDFWYLDGLSLAPDNVNVVTGVPATTRGSMFLYGPSLGLDVRF